MRLPDERILRVSKPLFLPFISQSFSFLLISILWSAANLPLVLSSVRLGGPEGLALQVLTILLLAPTWLSVLGVLRLALIHANTIYAATDRRILVRSGLVGSDRHAIDMADVYAVVEITDRVDRLFGCGGIELRTGAVESRGAPWTRLTCLPDARSVVDLIRHRVPKGRDVSFAPPAYRAAPTVMARA